MAIKKPAAPAGNRTRKPKPVDKPAGKPAEKPVAASKAGSTSAVALNTTGPTVVGIAGSAGALAALQSFFSALPAETGLAFVVVTHLSPEHESHMASLLQAHTKMSVTQVTKQMPVRPDHVYVIPPSKNIMITDSHVDVAEFDEPHGKRTPIDFFFRTLARSHRDAVAIILSGGGTDGSVGVKDLKEEGGLLMVQDPEEAEHPSMPNAAIATGLVDVVLPTRSLADKLMQYARHIPHLPLEAETLDEHEWAIIQDILMQVQRRTKHDFSQYKHSTILRRVRRRMLLGGQATLDAYLDHLRSHPEESFALLNDLLIGVTNFFRDHAAWETLKQETLPPIFKNKDLANPIRVWSVGCATGEEAYSLAMVFLEVASQLQESRTIQIFASDIDEDSLARSREGLYPAAIEADVSSERLERFFTRQGDHYRVRRELRDMVLFTPHSVLRDPPFSHQDLIVCRNLLIYLQRDIQQSVLDIFHYALLPGGYLFLGNSESTTGKEAFFQTANKNHHIYQSVPGRSDRARTPSVPMIVQPADRFRLPYGSRPGSARPAAEPLFLEEQHRRSLEVLAPPSILVSGEFAILHVSDTAGRYLTQPKGPITSNLLKLARPELQGELHTALFQAFEKNRASISPSILVELEGEPRRLIISVHPRVERTQSGQAAEKQALVVFLEETVPPEPAAGEAPLEGEGPQLAQGSARLLQLESEVRRLRDQLQTTQEEYESTTEEMRAANEELQSTNEEYHLTTEELETSKEELEALNEELQTVNNELKAKLDEISRAHQDLENVMGATEIATLFLDRSLRIQRFTPTLSRFLNILPSDTGRPINHFNYKLGSYGELTQDAQNVMNNLHPVDREVRGEEGQWYLVRLRPYRTIEDNIEGVVITLVDITPLKEAETALRSLNENLEARVEERTRELEALNRRLEQTGNMFSTLFNVNPIPTSLTRLEDGVFLDINQAYSQYFGIGRDDAVGRTSHELHLPFLPRQRTDLIQRLKKEGIIRGVELELTFSSAAPRNRNVLVSVQRLNVDGVDALLSTFIDITGRVQAERQIRTLAANLTAAEQKERHRISQILHDDLQQRLFAIKMQLSFLQQAYQEGNSAGIQTDTKNLENWLSDAIETTRRLSVDLSPVILQGSSFADSIGWLTEEMRERYGLDVSLEVKNELPRVDEHMRILLFECMRELMFNIVKHSDILKASVVLEHVDSTVRVMLTDHGKGFDAETVMSDPKVAHGLLDIRNRLQLLGCALRVKSHPGDGTEVTIEVPL